MTGNEEDEDILIIAFGVFWVIAQVRLILLILVKQILNNYPIRPVTDNLLSNWSYKYDALDAAVSIKLVVRLVFENNIPLEYS